MLVIKKSITGTSPWKIKAKIPPAEYRWDFKKTEE
jgi:hypothetical protein